MCAEPNFIDDQFINEWHPKYGETEHDEPEYRRLVDIVRSEIETVGSLTKQTFYSIVRWKKALRGGWIDWDNFDTYSMAIKNSLEVSGIEKMNLLVEMPGIGAPVASTLLHFIYPSLYPIIDKRTVGVLWYYGYIQHKATDIKRYHPFKDVVLSIQKHYPKWSLREIDKAVFAYHKQNPDLFGTLSNPCNREY